jgi:hypothetical protein
MPPSRRLGRLAISPPPRIGVNKNDSLMGKNSFLFYRDWYDVIKGLPVDEQLDVFNAIMAYAFDGETPSDKYIHAITALMRSTIDRDNNKYADVCQKRKDAIEKRWAKYKSIQNIQKYTNDTNHTNYTNYTDNDNDNDNDNVNDNDNDNGSTNVDNNKKEKEIQKKKKFIKPTIAEVEAYCKERQNYVNAEAFVDFYESKGWKVGNSPMKDWKAAVRTWEKKDGRKPVNPRLGVDEWIDERGERRYGTGKIVPMDAPPRPARDYYWSRESNSWITG